MKKMAIICSLFLSVVVFAGVGDVLVADAKEQSSYELIDTHLHYLDFMQDTEGFENLVKKMDETNVSHAVVFGMAMAKQWDETAPNEPTYYLSNDSRTYYFSATDYFMMQDFMEQPKEIRDRFFPFVCGVNPNDKNAADLVRKVLEDYPGEFYGIGELMSRHDDLTALTYGEPPRADSEAFLEIYDLAAEYDLPVLIHHNVAPSYMDNPIYLGEMQRALAHNRETDIIWAHVGISRRVEISNLLKITEQMLQENENLYYDISWVVYDDYIAKDLETQKKWAALIEKYPDRFMIGSDQVGHWSTYSKEITKYYSLLDLLSDSTVQKVCTDNILKLMNVSAEELAERAATGAEKTAKEK